VGVLPGTTITTVAISPTLPPHNNITNSTTSGASSAELMGSNNPVKIVVLLWGQLSLLDCVRYEYAYAEEENRY
jgi:hypothetical protein